MKFNPQGLYEAQRKAFDILVGVQPGSPFKVKPNNVTMDARLQQELAWVNTTNTYNFHFGTNAPIANFAVAPQLNNVILGENNVFCAYGISLLFGENNNAAGRIYRSVNITVNDGALYNGTLSMKFESTTPVDKMRTMWFREEGDFIAGSGMFLINPFRIFTGRTATLDVIVELPNISGLALTANMVVQCSLHGALGLA